MMKTIFAILLFALTISVSANAAIPLHNKIENCNTIQIVLNTGYNKSDLEKIVKEAYALRVIKTSDDSKSYKIYFPDLVAGNRLVNLSRIYYKKMIQTAFCDARLLQPETDF